MDDVKSEKINLAEESDLLVREKSLTVLANDVAYKLNQLINEFRLYIKNRNQKFFITQFNGNTRYTDDYYVDYMEKTYNKLRDLSYELEKSMNERKNKLNFIDKILVVSDNEYKTEVPNPKYEYEYQEEDVHGQNICLVNSHDILSIVNMKNKEIPIYEKFHFDEVDNNVKNLFERYAKERGWNYVYFISKQALLTMLPLDTNFIKKMDLTVNESPDDTINPKCYMKVK